ncbi:MAG: T9SS type A sorting domain-containing protein [Sphingobacteriales bacterium]|nr:T9SS type A sorting domain-containing protein [Sphingobacteriales bacterium]
MGEWQEKEGPLRRRVIIKNDGNNNEDRRVEKVIIIRDKNGEVITEDISPLIKDFDIEIGDEVMEDGNLTLNILIRDLETADQNVVKDVFTPATADNAKTLSDKTLHIAVNNYPNPTEGTFTVSFYAPETGTLNVRVADAQGKLVFNETLDHFSGQYQKELDLSANTKGTYFLQITQNGKSLSKKVIVD